MATTNSTLTAERLRELLHYDPETGMFTWRTQAAQRTKIGSLAGWLDPRGYRHIEVCGKSYLAHRLAWLYVTGTWPTIQIDHIDGQHGNNRFKNLRDVTITVNQQNRRHARKDAVFSTIGVSRTYKTRFRARITINGKQIFLGYFNTLEEARKAYLKAKREHHEGCTI